MPNLLEHSKQHFSAEVTKGGRLVRVDSQGMGSYLNILVAQWQRVDHQLDQGVLLDVGDSVDHLEKNNLSPYRNIQQETEIENSQKLCPTCKIFDVA
jgi:hypothetical protein